MRWTAVIAFALLAACSQSPAGEYFHTGAPLDGTTHLVISHDGTYREQITRSDPFGHNTTTVAYGHWQSVARARLSLGIDSAQDYSEGFQMASTESGTQKPKPIISGPSHAEGIAKFACQATYDDLTPERRERLKVSILDSLACAINALGAGPTEACVAQAKEFGDSTNSRCTLIGGGKGNVVYAALANTALVRYVDFMDSYLSHGTLCHPSDNTGAVLAACEHVGSSGKEFLLALAVAYQVDAALTDAVPWMAHGFDLTTPLSFSIGAGVSK